MHLMVCEAALLRGPFRSRTITLFHRVQRDSSTASTSHNRHSSSHTTDSAKRDASKKRVASPWTAEELQVLSEMTQAGCSAQAIGDALGRSLMAVYQKRHVFKLDPNTTAGNPPQRWTKDEDDRLESMCMERRPWPEIVAAFAPRSVQSVQSRWKYFIRPFITTGRNRGAADHGRGWTREETELLVHSRRDLGLAWPEICELLPHVSRPAIRTKWQRMKLSVSSKAPS